MTTTPVVLCVTPCSFGASEGEDLCTTRGGTETNLPSRDVYLPTFVVCGRKTKTERGEEEGCHRSEPGTEKDPNPSGHPSLRLVDPLLEGIELHETGIPRLFVRLKPIGICVPFSLSKEWRWGGIY